MIIIIEATINLAYYKDVVFGFMVLIEFSGMLYFSIQTDRLDPQAQNGQTDKSLTSIQRLLIGIMVYSFVTLIFTLVFNWDSVFYTKARQFNRKQIELRNRQTQALE
jgi:hypothetical protein